MYDVYFSANQQNSGFNFKIKYFFLVNVYLSKSLYLLLHDDWICFLKLLTLQTSQMSLFLFAVQYYTIQLYTNFF